MTLQERCETLRTTLISYNEMHIRKHNIIIEEMKKYLHKFTQYDISVPEKIIDDELVLDLGDDFYVIPVDVVFTFWDEKNYIPTETLCKIIEWYLEKYHPNCKLIKRV